MNMPFDDPPAGRESEDAIIALSVRVDELALAEIIDT
jgi:hypothetical protein